MARPPAPETGQAAQEVIAGTAAKLVRAAWPRLNISNLPASLPTFTKLIAAIVQKYGQASGAAAMITYRQARAEAGVSSLFTPKPLILPAPNQVEKSVNWATNPLWNQDPNEPLALNQLTAATGKLVQDVGRNATIDTARADPDASGWYRKTEGTPCYFCALLASRGAVYLSEGSAEFQPHDHCHCHPVPIFGGYTPTAQVKEWQRIYQDHAAGKKDQLKEFRRAYEKKFPPAPSTSPAKPKRTDGLHNYTKADRTQALSLLRQAKGSAKEYRRLLTEAGIDPSSVPNGAL